MNASSAMASTQETALQAKNVSTPGSSRPFLIALALFLLGIEAAAYFYLLPHGVAQLMDLRQLYTAGYMLRTEPTHLYDVQRQVVVQQSLTDKSDGVLPFNHAPFEALFFLPLSYLKYSTAYSVMLVIDVALIGICFFTQRPLFSYLIPLWQPRPGLVFFPFLPVSVCMMHGQDALFFLAICCIVLRLFQSQEDFLSGLLLSITLFKPQIALPLAMLLTVRRGWRFLAGFSLGSLLVGLLCLQLVHLDGLRAFLHMIAFTNAAGLHHSLSHDPSGLMPLSMPNLHGLLFLVLLYWLPISLWLPVTALVSGAALLWTIRRIRLIPDEETAFAYAILWAILLSYLIHIGDLPLWILPICVLARSARYPNRAFFLLHSLFILPLLLLFVAPDPQMSMWFLALPMLASALYLGERHKMLSRSKSP